jgi:hypothetical protein
VVVSCVVVGTTAFFVVEVVVVVVAGAGFSTTVVHELRARATARSGVRMISFFIVGMVSFTADSVQVFRPDVFRTKFFEFNSRPPGRGPG